MSLFALITWVLLLAEPVPQADAALKPVDRCRECHAMLDERLGNPAREFADDIHGARGFTCADCHGGNPREEDADKAMDRRRGFRGALRRSEIPELCARCHADGAFMRAYNPSLRTDQLAQYRTSVHGKRLLAGDPRVAVCTDCHGVHSIRPASSSLSSVHPLKIPITCARCHADADYMKAYRIPTDQFASYRASAHFEVLSRGDLSAPTCATCHGNHGAAPPGMASVERVCGTCHVFQEKLFDQSPHKSPWEAVQMPACITCHGNHRIERTRDAMIGTGKESMCLNCHGEGDAGWKTAQQIYGALTGLDAALREASAVLDRAERVGMEVGEPRVILASGEEKLTKARVDLHTLNLVVVGEATTSGLRLASQARQGGEQALAEYVFRRKGLALSLVVIGFVVAALWMLIRSIEQPQAARRETSRS